VRTSWAFLSPFEGQLAGFPGRAPPCCWSGDLSQETSKARFQNEDIATTLCIVITLFTSKSAITQRSTRVTLWPTGPRVARTPPDRVRTAVQTLWIPHRACGGGYEMESTLAAAHRGRNPGAPNDEISCCFHIRLRAQAVPSARILVGFEVLLPPSAGPPGGSPLGSGDLAVSAVRAGGEHHVYRPVRQLDAGCLILHPSPRDNPGTPNPFRPGKPALALGKGAHLPGNAGRPKCSRRSDDLLERTPELRLNPDPSVLEHRPLLAGT
jgi:hypothetical protein